MTVTLTFPVVTKEQSEKKHEEAKKQLISNIKGKRILIAEDNELNAEIAMTILQENGILSECAEERE